MALAVKNYTKTDKVFSPYLISLTILQNIVGQMPALKVTYHEINVNAHSSLWFMNLMKNVTVAYLETCETSMMAFFWQK